MLAESVNEGHPDKLADQVSDAILDACLKDDPESKVACETATKTNMVRCLPRMSPARPVCPRRPPTRVPPVHPFPQVMVFGEITTTAKVDYEKVVRDTVRLPNGQTINYGEVNDAQFRDLEERTQLRGNPR